MIAPDASTTRSSASPAPNAAPPQQAATPASSSGFSFSDLVEMINPLQHIPVISTIYRAITGDTIKTFDKVAGDLLYGGPIGFISSLADTVFQAVTGKDVGDTMLAFFTGGSDSPKSNALAASLEGSAPTKVALATDITPPDLTALSSPAAPIPSSNSDPGPVAAASLAPLTGSASPALSALWTSLSKSGIDPGLAQRAAFAYQRATALALQPSP